MPVWDIVAIRRCKSSLTWCQVCALRRKYIQMCSSSSADIFEKSEKRCVSIPHGTENISSSFFSRAETHNVKVHQNTQCRKQMIGLPNGNCHNNEIDKHSLANNVANSESSSQFLSSTKTAFSLPCFADNSRKPVSLLELDSSCHSPAFIKGSNTLTNLQREYFKTPSASVFHPGNSVVTGSRILCSNNPIVVPSRGYKSIKFDEVKPVTPEKMQEFLKSHDIAYEHGHTCLITTCPKFTVKRIKLKQVDKLYINTTTGMIIIVDFSNCGNFVEIFIQNCICFYTIVSSSTVYTVHFCIRIMHESKNII